MSTKVRIIWKRSSIGYNKHQAKVMKALGLRRLNDVVEHQDSPQIRGMIRKVQHLVEVEGLD